MTDELLYAKPATSNMGVAESAPHGLQSSLSEMLPNEEMTKAWIDPVILALIVQLFPSYGMAFFARLCAEAIQPSLFPASMVEQIASISVPGIVSLCKLPGWEWKRETTLKMLQVLEALTIINRRRSKKATLIEILLGKRAKVLTKEELLARLNQCYEEMHNKKTRQLIVRVRARLERYGVPSYEEACVLLDIDREALRSLHDQLLTCLQNEGLPTDLCTRLVQVFDQKAAPILIAHRQAAEIERITSLESHTSSGSRNPFEVEAQITVVQETAMSTEYEEAKAPLDTDTSQSPKPRATARKRCKRAAQSGTETPDEVVTSTSAESRPCTEDELEEAVLCSQRNSTPQDLCLDIDLSHRELVFSSEAQLQEEAMRYMRLIDGDHLSPTSKWVKGVRNGYKNRIQATPVRAAVSLINALLRKYCPIRGVEEKQRIPRTRFYTSYNLYGDPGDPLPVSEEIKEWLASPYSYEEIASALVAWEKLHEQDLWDQRPSVANVVASGLLKVLEEVPADTGFQGERDAFGEQELWEYPELDAPWVEKTCVALLSAYTGYHFAGDILVQFQREASSLVSVHTRCRVEACLVYLLEAEPSRAYVETDGNGFLSLSLYALDTLSVSPGGLIALVDRFLPEAYQYLLERLATGENGILVGYEMEIEGEVISGEEYRKLCWKAYDAIWTERYDNGVPDMQREDVDQRSALMEDYDREDGEPEGVEEAGLACGEETMHVLTALLWARQIAALALPMGYCVELQVLPDTQHGILYVEERTDPDNRCICETEAQAQTLLEAFEREAQEQKALQKEEGERNVVGPHVAQEDIWVEGRPMVEVASG